MNKIKKEEQWIYLEPDKTSFTLRQELLEWLVSKGWHLAYIKFEEDKVTLKIARTSEEKPANDSIVAKEDSDNTIRIDEPENEIGASMQSDLYRRIEAVEERMKKIEEKVEDMNTWGNWWNTPQWPQYVPCTQPNIAPSVPWLQPIYASDPELKYTDVRTCNPSPYKSRVTCTYNVNC